VIFRELRRLPEKDCKHVPPLPGQHRLMKAIDGIEQSLMLAVDYGIMHGVLRFPLHDLYWDDRHF
jgi:hypothetical protein